MKIVNVHEARTTLLELVELVENGEDVVLARAGTPVAQVAQVAQIVALRVAEPRVLGQWRGRVRMADDFDAPLPEFECLPRTP